MIPTLLTLTLAAHAARPSVAPLNTFLEAVRRPGREEVICLRTKEALYAYYQLVLEGLSDEEIGAATTPPTDGERLFSNIIERSAACLGYD